MRCDPVRSGPVGRLVGQGIEIEALDGELEGVIPMVLVRRLLFATS